MITEMNIAIDGRPLLHERSGVGCYTYQLIRKLLREKSGHNFYLYGLPGHKNYVYIPRKAGINGLEQILNFPEPIQVPFPFRKVTRIMSGLAGRLGKRHDIDVILWTNFFGEFSEKCRSIITIHDMAHHYYPQFITPGMERNLPIYLKDQAHRSDLILCVSENTKRDVVKLLDVPEEKVWVTYNGIGEQFRPLNEQMAIGVLCERYKLPARFILFVGTREPRKNLPKLVEAYNILYSRYRIQEYLVIAGGKGWKNESLYQTIEELKLENRVIFTGYVPDADLPGLYNAATVFAYPSLYEGFGIPVVEAMACGVPVVTSNVSSLPEVAGDAALLVAPEDPEQLASAIYRILEDRGLSNKLREIGIQRAKKFSWQACARKTLEAIEYVVKHP